MFKNANNHNLLDDNLRQIIALPAAASSTVYTGYIDLQGHTNTGYVPAFELGVNIPALSTTILPNAATMTAFIQLSDDPTFATGVLSPALYATPGTTGTPGVATGASGAGSVSVEGRMRVPAQCPRYARAGFTSSAGTTTAAAVSGEFAAIF